MKTRYKLLFKRMNWTIGEPILAKKKKRKKNMRSSRVIKIDTYQLLVSFMCYVFFERGRSCPFTISYSFDLQRIFVSWQSLPVRVLETSHLFPVLLVTAKFSKPNFLIMCPKMSTVSKYRFSLKLPLYSFDILNMFLWNRIYSSLPYWKTSFAIPSNFRFLCHISGRHFLILTSPIHSLRPGLSPLLTTLHSDNRSLIHSYRFLLRNCLRFSAVFVQILPFYVVKIRT